MKELFNHNSIQECLFFLKDGQMIPLDITIDKIKPLILKIDEEEYYNALKDNPSIESCPFFIEIKKENSYAYICYLFIRVFIKNSRDYLIFETVFDITNEKIKEDCLNIICEENNAIILLSNNDSVPIKYNTPDYVIITRKALLENLIQNQKEGREKLDVIFAVNFLQNLKEDVHDLYLFLKQAGEEFDSPLLQLEITGM